MRVTTYPAPAAVDTKHNWAWTLSKVDAQLSKIMDEMYAAKASSLLILASVGLRTAFDRSTEFLRIDPGLSLASKVKKLFEDGFSGETEAQTLKDVTDAGSAAAHPGWSPDEKEFAILLDMLEQ